MKHNSHRILIVEDDEINAFVLEKQLNGLFEVHRAKTGSEAIEKASIFDFEYVLMDIDLGSHAMDGVETFKRIKPLFKNQKTRVFAITCFAQDEDKTRFLKEGFDAYFTKPVRRPQLLDAMMH